MIFTWIGEYFPPEPPNSALEIIGTLNIDSAKTKIDAGVANLIRVSLSMMGKKFTYS